MELVEIFKVELQSVLDHRPPVSKAKMAQITRAAIKGSKFYKHIVMSVEKFIAKSRPEYKIPGLYVIDSIVRQSRHQFGKERDVYAPRFARNLHITFDNLFSGCTPEDRSRIVRVLNLWQKNGVFNSQTIQPLLDMANPKSAVSLIDSSSLSCTSNHQNELSDQVDGNNHSKFSKSVLDFDYGEDDDDDADETPTEAEPPLSSTLSKIELQNRRATNDNMNSISDYQLIQQPPTSQQMSLNNNISTQQKLNDPDPVLERWNKIIKQQNINSPMSNSTVTNSQSSSTVATTPVSYSRERYIASLPKGPMTITHHNQDNYTTQLPTSPPSSPQQVAVTAKIPSPPPQQISITKNVCPSEKEAERKRKCLPRIKDRHVTVCSSTLWLGHVPKTVSEAEISDAFGEFGTINSIDLIPPRGCAYVCMDRRQDAKKALSASKGLKLNGSHIKTAWAPGKGLKEYKNLKEFFELDSGCAYIPYGKIDSTIDFDVLEEGGVIDEDSMSYEMRELRDRKAKEKEKEKELSTQSTQMTIPVPSLPILSQPPPFTLPPPNLSVPPPIPGWSIHGQSLAHGVASIGVGGIHFPPPPITTSGSSSSSNNINSKAQISQLPIFDSKNIDNDVLKSPNSIDQQLSMTEQQISIVEQQLNLIQRAQSLTQQAPSSSIPSLPPLSNMSPMPQHPMVSQASVQPNPLIFDLPPPPIAGHQQMSVFANPAFLGQSLQILPTSQANNDIDGGQMANYDGRF